MNPASLMSEIEQAAGEIWMEGERLKFRAVPARLIPLIRENKAALLALLAVPAVRSILSHPSRYDAARAKETAFTAA